jgi:two-component system invasion response regulator UvrY
MTIDIVLVDDHALIRRGLRETLSEDSELNVVAEAADYGEWRKIARSTRCDVVVLDISLPGRSGIEILSAIQELENLPKVVMLSQYTEDQYGIRALKAGAMAYLNKSTEPAKIIAAVKSVASGRKYVTPEIAEALMDSIGDKRDKTTHENLSEREMETLLLIAKGQKLAAMAKLLMLSPKTVSVYRARIMEKLGLSSNAEMAAYALRHHLID